MYVHNIAELEALLGNNIRALRLQRNIDRASVAASAGVSESALKNLELGKGANLKTLLSVIRYFGKEDWLQALAPKVTISPLNMVKAKPVRERASRRKAGSGAA